MDDLKAVKDELLTKITKVDREIAKTESQIAKLKKKYVCYFLSIPFVTYIYNLLLINFTFFSPLQQEQEEHANKPLSDSHDEDSVVEEKPKNQSIAQVIYAENRVRIFQKLTILELFGLHLDNLQTKDVMSSQKKRIEYSWLAGWLAG